MQRSFRCVHLRFISLLCGNRTAMRACRNRYAQLCRSSIDDDDTFTSSARTVGRRESSAERMPLALACDHFVLVECSHRTDVALDTLGALTNFAAAAEWSHAQAHAFQLCKNHDHVRPLCTHKCSHARSRKRTQTATLPDGLH